MKKLTLIPGILLCLAAHSVRADEAVTIESLLMEMVDRDSVARFPQKEFRLKQHSSYNRASKTPDDPEGWFANGDFNTPKRKTNLIRVEERNGQKEFVLMDHEGAGAIVRTWMPFRSPPEESQIRFYLDGSDTPALEGNVCTLLNGAGLIPYPFAHPSLMSAVSFFPIPYAKSCKVTMTGDPFFFQFTFREYEEGREVRTFTLEDFAAAQGLIEKTGKELLSPKVKGLGQPLSLEATLAAGEEKSLSLPSGEAAVRELSVKLDSYTDPEVTRKVVLKMEFDGKATVWCPIGDFFGSGIGLNPVQGWYRTVAEDGTMSCRWVMPYKEKGVVSLVNLGEESVDATLAVNTGDWDWDDRSMYFHAAWRGQYPVPTRPRSDWNYVTLKGRGVYVGDTLTIMNPVETWWGEGDERIWVDGEDFPSIFGTGTEDYYAYSWGGVSTDFYEHPFHAQPFSHRYNKLNRKPKEKAGVRNTKGFSTETRSRSLDTMPFGSSLQLDMEVWSGADCEMGYQVGTYWYGFADTTSNCRPDPEEVLNVPPLPDLDAPSPKSVHVDVPMPGVESAAGGFEGAVECEQMTLVSKSGEVNLRPQNLKKYKGTWSQAKHVLFRDARVGDVVELRIPTTSPKAEKLVLHATRSYDFGILKFAVNGQPVAEGVDLYAGKPSSSGPVELGTFKSVDGAYLLRAEVTGKNPKSKGALFGIDCVTLSSTDAASGAANTTKKPNVIVIMADDLGYADVGCYGCKDIPTPHIDKLAEQGVRFTSGYVTWPMCGPSRAGFLTGRYQSTFGYYRNASLPFDPKQGLPKIETIAGLLQEQGYVTGGVGKWHMGTSNDQHPNSMGFDDWFGFLSGGLMYFPLDHPSYKGRFTPLKRPAKWRDIHHTLPVIHNMEPVEWDQYLTRELTDAGIAFVEGNRAKPFFLFMSYNAPHLDLEAPEETIAKFPPESMTRVPGVKPGARSIYGAMVYEMDEGIGRLLAKVDELGLAGNTVVWFLSDNGGLGRTSDNRPLKGGKGSPHEGGLRVPMIVKWPGQTPAGVVLEEAVTSLDIGATAIAMAGGDPAASGLHGKDIRPYITQQSTEAPHDVLFWHTGRAPGSTGVIRDGDFKLIITKGRAALYNLKDDLGETNNLAESQPERVQEMLVRWNEWNTGNKPALWGKPEKDYQYADYEWLKGSQHYKAQSN